MTVLKNGTGFRSDIKEFDIKSSLIMDQERLYIDKAYWDKRYSSKEESFEW